MDDGDSPPEGPLGDLDLLNSSDPLVPFDLDLELIRSESSECLYADSKMTSGRSSGVPNPSPLLNPFSPSSAGGTAFIQIDPMSIGTLVPKASNPTKPAASPAKAIRPRVEKKNADSPKPARTAPVALARLASGNDLAVALTAAARPAEPAEPVKNIATSSSDKRREDGGAWSEAFGARSEIALRRNSRMIEYPVNDDIPPRSNGL